jgi:hypothetical protein
MVYPMHWALTIGRNENTEMGQGCRKEAKERIAYLHLHFSHLAE